MPVSVLEGRHVEHVTEFEYVPVVWWKPWTWNRIAASRTTQVPEWTPDDVLILLAAQMAAEGLDANGIPMSEALDPANQYQWIVEGPTVNWATHALSAHQDAYYKKYDRPGAPVNRAGHLWQVRLAEQAGQRREPGEPADGSADDG